MTATATTPTFTDEQSGRTTFVRDTLTVFRRAMRISLRNPVWSVMGLLQPVLAGVVTALVGFGPDPAGGYHLTGIALTVRGEVEGLDAAGFAEVAQEAKATCPVSKALTGVEITLDAALV